MTSSTSIPIFRSSTLTPLNDLAHHDHLLFGQLDGRNCERLVGIGVGTYGGGGW